MTNITRYDINEHGELPLSNGRYVRWEDVEDLLIAHAKEINQLHSKIDDCEDDYSTGFDDGWQEGYEAALGGSG